MKPLLYGLTIGAVTGLYGSYKMREFESRLPDYDMPVKERYEKFADIELNDVEKEAKGLEKEMSHDAFIKSVISPKPELPVWVAYPRHDGKLLTEKTIEEDKEILRLINLVDKNKDGRVSYEEYLFFLNLLSCKLGNINLAYKLFDDSLTSEQVCKILRVDPQTFSYFFPEKTTYHDFESIVMNYREQVLKQEFSQHDFEQKGHISIEAFSELVTKSIHFNTITGATEFKQKLNLLKTKGFFSPSGRITFDIFKAFNILQNYSQDIARLIKMYAQSGNRIEKKDFSRAVRIISNIQLEKNVVDLVYALFEKDGSLDYKEFTETLSKK